jgi:hypothetical protein
VNPFTKGKKVRAIRDTESRGGNADIGAGAVLEVSHTSDDSGHLFNAWHPNGIDVYALAKDDFEPVDATPAPLDPSKVKAGDTVTVRVEEFDIPDPYEVTGKAYVGPIGMAVGGFLLSGDRVNLTDHQPAPEPEPELPTIPGSLIKSEAGDLVFLTKAMWLDQDHDERNPSDWAAPWTQMVVIDPEAVDMDALTTTFHNASHYGVDLPLEGAAYLARLARTFFVGGESR